MSNFTIVYDPTTNSYKSGATQSFMLHKNAEARNERRWTSYSQNATSGACSELADTSIASPPQEPPPAKICFITAIFGNYELSCKPFVKQTIETDFICFTDNARIRNPSGWIIDTHPYHLTHKSNLDNGKLLNSLSNNKHTFNVAKYYKQAFNNIPILAKYDVVVWLDGTIEIIYDKTSEYIMTNIYSRKIIGWHHDGCDGYLCQELYGALLFGKYATTSWLGQPQPYQDIVKQYVSYIRNGYDENYFRNMGTHTPNLGVWVTCFVAFLKNDPHVKEFLDLWYLQTLQYSTEDQIGFQYVAFATKLTPYTLPDHEVHGDIPHKDTMFYVKHDHMM